MGNIGVVEYFVATSCFKQEAADPRWREYQAKAATSHIAHGLLEQGYIRFRERDTPSGYGPEGAQLEIIASVGVVSKGHVAAIQERELAAQKRAVPVLVQAACEAVQQWGAFREPRDSGYINKRDAVREIREAIARAAKSLPFSGHHNDNG